MCRVSKTTETFENILLMLPASCEKSSSRFKQHEHHHEQAMSAKVQRNLSMKLGRAQQFFGLFQMDKFSVRALAKTCTNFANTLCLCVSGQ